MGKKVNRPTVAGKSFLFNALFVIINLIGLALVVTGYHDSYEGSRTTMKILGFGLMILTIFGFIIFQGRLMMANVSRVLVGGLFIVSGLVKANDPLGFAFKLEEYFEDGALAYRIKEWFNAPEFSLEFLMEYALILSVIICIFEIVIGVFLIIGAKIKPISYLLLLMMGFFTFLTWHTASCDASKKFIDRDIYLMSNPTALVKIEQAKTDKEIRIISQDNEKVVIDQLKQPQCVDDCGCFGDAMKGSVGRSLTPKESFWKDIIVFYLGLWIFLAQWIIEPNTRKQNLIYGASAILVVAFFSYIFSWYFPILFAFIGIVGALWMLRAGGKFLGNYFGSALFVIAISTLFIVVVLRYEPMKDYRPYAVGNNMLELMNNGEAGIYKSMLRYKNKKTGEEKLFDSSTDEYIQSKIWENKDFKYVDMVQQVIKPTKLPSITEQFNPFIPVSNITEDERKLGFIQKTLDSNQIQMLKLKYKDTNVVIDVVLDDYSEENYNPKKIQISDTFNVLNPELTEINLRNYITTTDKIIIVSVRNLHDANWDALQRYKEIFAGAKKENIPMILLCSASNDAIQAFKQKYDVHIPIFVNDEIELKTIARSNPAMLVIKKGIISGKFPHRSTPTFSWLFNNTLTNL